MHLDGTNRLTLFLFAAARPPAGGRVREAAWLVLSRRHTAVHGTRRRPAAGCSARQVPRRQVRHGAVRVWRVAGCPRVPRCGHDRTRVAGHRKAPYRRPERRRLFGVSTFTLTESSRIGHRKRDAAACLADAHPEGMSGVRLGSALNMRHGMVHGTQDQKVVEHPGRAGLGGCKS